MASNKFRGTSSQTNFNLPSQTNCLNFYNVQMNQNDHQFNQIPQQHQQFNSSNFSNNSFTSSLIKKKKRKKINVDKNVNQDNHSTINNLHLPIVNLPNITRQDQSNLMNIHDNAKQLNLQVNSQSNSKINPQFDSQFDHQITNQFNSQLNSQINPQINIIQNKIEESKALQFKIVKPNSQTNDGGSLKFKITTTRKVKSKNIDFNTRQKSNLNHFIQNNNDDRQTIYLNEYGKNLSNSNFLIQQASQSNSQPNYTSNSLEQQLHQSNLNNSFNSSKFKNTYVQNTTTVVKGKLSTVEAATSLINTNNLEEHEENCVCWNHANKGKKNPNQLLTNLNNSDNNQTTETKLNNKNNHNFYASSSSYSSSNSSSNSSSSTSSRSCSKISRQCSHHKSNENSLYSTTSSSYSSSSSSSTSRNSSKCSTSSCSSSNSYSSRSSSPSSCKICSSANSSPSSRSSSCVESEKCSISSNFINNKNRGRSKQKCILNKKVRKNDLINKKMNMIKDNNSETFTQQLLNNVNETLLKHQKQQKLNSKINESFNFSSDLPSPSTSTNNVNLNSLSQPSSVSCESNCYSPSVSINSPNCQAMNKKRDPIEERQRLRSYRIPHLQNRDSNKISLNTSDAIYSSNSKDASTSYHHLNNNQTSLPNTFKDIDLNFNNNLSQNVVQEDLNLMKKLKKKTLKGEKKKLKLKRNSLKKEEKKINKQKIKNSKQSSLNNKNSLNNKSSKKIKLKKKGKKLKKFNKLNKTDSKDAIICDAKIINSVNRSHLINQHLINRSITSSISLNDSSLLNLTTKTSTNTNQNLNKMCLLMNANLNMGIPPNFDKNEILPDISALIQNIDFNTVNNFNLNAISNTNNNLNNNSAINSLNKSIESLSQVNEKSPDSGIQSQSDSPNQITLVNSNTNLIYTENKNSANLSTSTSLNNISKLNDKKKVKKSINKLKNIPQTSNADNFVKQNLNSMSTFNLNNLTESQQSNFNNLIGEDIQKFLKNLQKSTLMLPSSENNENPSSQIINENNLFSSSNLSMIKPKSVPSDLIILTEMLLNMSKGKDEQNLINTNINNDNSIELNKFLQNNSIDSTNNLNQNLPMMPILNSESQKSETLNKKEDDFDVLVKNINDSICAQFKNEKNDDFTLNQINQNSLNIKNIDLWRNPKSVGSPLTIEQHKSSLKSRNYNQNKNEVIKNKNLSSKKIKNDKNFDRKAISKNKSKKKKQEKFLDNLDSNSLDSLFKNHDSNKNSKKRSSLNLFKLNEEIKNNDSDSFIKNQNLEKNIEHQVLPRSISSLSQHHFSTNKQKKKKKKYKKYHNRNEIQISNLNQELNFKDQEILNKLANNFNLLRIQVNRDKLSSTKNNNSNSIFKCIKFIKNKKKNLKNAFNLQQLNSSKYDDYSETYLEKPILINKKRKKTNSISNNLDLNSMSNRKNDRKNEDKKEGANEHSLPLKKRHHRHTENKTSLSLVDSVDRNNFIENENNTRVSTRKSNQNNSTFNLSNKLRRIRCNSGSMQNLNESKDPTCNLNLNSAASNCDSIRENTNNDKKHTANTSQSTGSCVTLVKDNKNKNINVCPENRLIGNNSKNKNFSVCVDNKETAQPASSFNQFCDKPLNEDSNINSMVFYKKDALNTTRKLRSNQLISNEKSNFNFKKHEDLNDLIILSKVSNKQVDLTNSDEKRLRNKNVSNKKIESKLKSNSKEIKVIKNSLENDDNNKIIENMKINDLKDDNDLLITNKKLIQKSIPIKKKRKQNKTGFDKPKKRKNVTSFVNSIKQENNIIVDSIKEHVSKKLDVKMNEENYKNLEVEFANLNNKNEIKKESDHLTNIKKPLLNNSIKNQKRKNSLESIPNKFLKIEKSSINKNEDTTFPKTNKIINKDKKIENCQTIEKSEENNTFEEIVLKINSVLSTVLVKKPSIKNKIKIKGPTKKYLKAGLFSDTFKEDIIDSTVNESSENSNNNTSASNTPIHQCEVLIEEELQSENEDCTSKDNSVFNKEDKNFEEINLNEGKIRFEDDDEHTQYNGKEPVLNDNDEYSTLLPPPCYVYNKYRRKLNDFLLPFDIWWQHVNNQLQLCINPTKNYKKIKGNVFFDVKPTSNFDEQSCVCVKPEDPNVLGCGNDCLNRAMYVECNPNLCPCGDQCSNQKLLKNEWSSGLERFLTKNRGWGVRTTQLIKKSSFIIEYIGEIVSEKVFKDRMAETYSNDSNHYCLNITSGIVIDGYRIANEGRFVNHSCEPNCEMQKWSVNGYYRVGLFALCDIQPGEEVTYDYNFYNFNLETQQTCYCGSSKCRGVIGGKNQNKLNNQLNKDKNQNGILNLNSIDKLKIVKSILKKSDNKRKDCFLNKVENCGTFENSINSLDKKKFLESIKPISYTNVKFIRKHSLFLIRNFEKIRNIHNRQIEKQRKSKTSTKKSDIYIMNKTQSKDVFNPTYLNNGKSRSVRTRGLAKAQDNEELIKIYKICNVFKDVYQNFCSIFNSTLDEDLIKLFKYFKENPKQNKKRNELNSDISINLVIIERNILSGVYKHENLFSKDMKKFFENCLSYLNEENLKNDKFIKKINDLEEQFNFILESKMKEFNLCEKELECKIEQKENKCNISNKVNMKLPGILRIYLSAITQTTKNTLSLLKNEYYDFINKSYNQNNVSTSIQELQPLYINLPKFKETLIEENEEMIRCICTLTKDEGTMIQCDKCNCWQHAQCMKADVNAETYLCEKCKVRTVDREVKLDQLPIDAVDGWTYYFTFLINDFMIKPGDCVYLEREKNKNQIMPSSSNISNSLTFIDFYGKKMLKSEVDIFRIERLYQDKEGKKFVFGHHCLRPSETFHEPTRKFFSNEVLSSPLGGSAPLESVKGICHVLDLPTYCKGRPLNAREEDVYICEFKVCRRQRSFNKVAKGYFSINTKPYCFNLFEERLHPKRTFSPHDISTFNKKDNKSVKNDKNKKFDTVPEFDLSKVEIENLNKIHLKAFAEKQFNIYKVIDKINLLNEATELRK